jgi:hypothetical protein
MSSSHQDDHFTETKPVAFTVPLILASVVLLIIVLFLSLCDPKHGHHAEGEANGHNAAAMEATHSDAAMEEHHEAAQEPAMKDSTAAPALAPDVEGKPEEAHH